MRKPVKPRMPKKPKKPLKKIPHFQGVADFFCSHNMTLYDFLKEAARNLDCKVDELDLKKVYVNFNGRFVLGEMIEIDHPEYSWLKRDYDKKMKRYEKRMAEYPERLELYEKTMPVYKAWKLSEKQDAKIQQLNQIQKEIDELEQKKEQLMEAAAHDQT